MQADGDRQKHARADTTWQRRAAVRGEEKRNANMDGDSLWGLTIPRETQRAADLREGSATGGERDASRRRRHRFACTDTHWERECNMEHERTPP